MIFSTKSAIGLLNLLLKIKIIGKYVMSSKYKKGDLISIPEDKFSAEEILIIINILEEEQLYEIYDVISQVKDFYSFNLIEGIGRKLR